MDVFVGNFFKSLFFLLFTINVFARDHIVFSPLPMQDEKTTFNTFYPMLKYLEKKLHKKVVFKYIQNYKKLLNDFQYGKIDLAYLGPLPYVELKKQYKYAEALVLFKNENGETTYTCSLVTTVGAKESKKVALTQPLSTCGYLSVNTLLHNTLENYKYRYICRHDLVALAVLKGKFDLGGLRTSIAQKYYHLGLEEIGRTKKLPMFSLIGNTKNLSKNELNDITTSLLYINRNELNDWGKSIKYGAKKAFESDYDALREMTKDLKIPQKGNF